jgi:hypothetical protein
LKLTNISSAMSRCLNGSTYFSLSFFFSFWLALFTVSSNASSSILFESSFYKF